MKWLSRLSRGVACSCSQFQLIRLSASPWTAGHKFLTSHQSKSGADPGRVQQSDERQIYRGSFNDQILTALTTQEPRRRHGCGWVTMAGTARSTVSSEDHRRKLTTACRQASTILWCVPVSSGLSCHP